MAAQGDVKSAYQEVRKGLKIAPNDPELLALEKLYNPDRNTRKIDENRLLANIRKTINSWLNPRKDDLNGPEGAASRELSYASPIRWGLRNPSREPPSSADAAVQHGLPMSRAGRNPLGDGLVKLQMGDYSAAERFFTTKIQEYPYNWLAFRMRAMARRNLKNPQGAYEDASAAIQLNPKDAWAYDARALALVDLGRHQEAIADADQALALNPKDGDAYNARAQALGGLGRAEEMLADLKRAAELDPQFEAAYRQALRSGSRDQPGAPFPGAGKLLRGVAPWVPWTLGLLAFVLTALWGSRRGGFTTQPHSSGHPVTTPPLPSALTTHAPAAGGVVDHFDIVRKLGQGGMGEVYEAMDRILQRRVALKKLRSEISGDARERRRFIREARAVAKLQHPHIVQIHSVMERPDGLYLVFELVAGRTLDAFVLLRNALPLREAWNLLRQVGSALDHAHAQGIIHRDLKPSNIMIHDQGVKVMDFGIARHVQEALSTLGRDEIIGTPAYMAPEQEHGQAFNESDLYALGICLYEALTGLLPFPGSRPQDLKMRKIYRPISDIATGISKELDLVMATILDPEPSKRYHSSREFLGAVEKVLLRA